MTAGRCRDIAHVSAAELRTAVPGETVEFFVAQLGLQEVARAGDSIYLHAWDDYEVFTVKVTAAPASGIGRTWLRAASPAALSRRVAAIEAAGLGRGWSDGECGIGPVFGFRDPDGHEFGLDIPAAARFAADALGAQLTEQIVQDDGEPSAVWYHLTDKSYDLVYTADWTSTTGRLHHIALACDQREDILRAADVCLEAGIHIETGPHKHAIQQTFFLYVWEPGGNRIELCNAGARLVLAPDWRPISWTLAERARGQAWGLPTIETFHTHGTPPAQAGRS